MALPLAHREPQGSPGLCPAHVAETESARIWQEVAELCSDPGSLLLGPQVQRGRAQQDAVEPVAVAGVGLSEMSSQGNLLR